jgi:glutathione S-transferase
MNPIVLYGDHRWDSPWVFSAFVALGEKKLPMTLRAVDLGNREQHAGDYPMRTLTARVPAIDHDGFVLSESLAIIEYLEDTFPAPDHPRILPEKREDRARARQVLGWLRSDLMPIREQRPTSSMFYERVTTPLTGPALVALETLLRVSEQLISEDDFLFGKFSMADAELSFALHRLILNGDRLPERIAAWARGVWQRPAIRAFVGLERSGSIA